MKISKKEVEKIAKLSRLYLSEDEKKSMAKDMGDILKYMEKLNELNTEKVEPYGFAIDFSNVFRVDKKQQSLKKQDALQNAPDKSSLGFKVPKVIE